VGNALLAHAAITIISNPHQQQVGKKSDAHPTFSIAIMNKKIIAPLFSSTIIGLFINPAFASPLKAPDINISSVGKQVIVNFDPISDGGRLQTLLCRISFIKSYPVNRPR
jgi:hypothetical protein